MRVSRAHRSGTNGNGVHAGQISVVVGDDHPAVLDAVRRALAEHQIHVVADARDGQSALEAIRRHRPSVAIVGLRMRKLSGSEIARSAGPGTAVCLYTAHRDRALLLDAIDAGVRGIVVKEAPLSELVHAIQLIAQGESYFDPLLAGVLVGVDVTQASAPVSERERTVLRFLADGFRNEAIGRELHIAADTVRAHIRNAMRKLGADTRTQAVAIALRRGLID